MRTKNSLAVMVFFSIGVAHGQPAAIEYEQKPLPPLPNSISGTETVDARMMAYLKREGFGRPGTTTLPDGRQVMITLGKGTIVVGPGDRNFVQARINAFGKAMLEAQMKCAESQQVSIETEMSSDMGMPGEQRAAADAKRMEREGLAKEGASQVSKALNADMKNAKLPAAIQTAGIYAEKILDNKVREELTKKGIDPNKPVAEQQVKAILNTSSFKNMAKAVAAERCTGIKVMASFEQNPASGQGSVGIVTVYTRKLHEIADAIVSGNYGLIPTGEPGKPIEEHIPSDLRTKLATFGTELVRNEKGEYVLLSFGQAQPASTSQQSKDLAYRMARLQAQAQIRLFMGVQVNSHNQMAAGEESIEREGNDIQTMFDTSANSSIKAVGDALPIRGLQEADSWETLHPANNSPVVGSVWEWKASSAQLAGAIRQLNQASSAKAAATAANGLPITRQSGSPVQAGGPTPRDVPRTSNSSAGEGGVRSKDF